MFPKLRVGENLVSFRLRNPTRHSVKVVGFSFCWGENCSFSLKREMPFDIPAGTTYDLECTLSTEVAGPFGTQIHFFLDDLGLREFVIGVTGMAMATD